MCSAITIPDMIYLIQYHGLVPIPLDLDPLTLSVSVEALKAANTEVWGEYYLVFIQLIYVSPRNLN
jgi:dTDP-4-amino-4,6-dideoxygalactose transaminase